MDILRLLIETDITEKGTELQVIEYYDKHPEEKKTSLVVNTSSSSSIELIGYDYAFRSRLHLVLILLGFVITDKEFHYKKEGRKHNCIIISYKKMEKGN